MNEYKITIEESLLCCKPRPSIDYNAHKSSQDLLFQHQRKFKWSLIQYTLSKTNLLVLFFGTTAGQQTTHYLESALWNRLKADLKKNNLVLVHSGRLWGVASSPKSFPFLTWLDWLLTTRPALSLALLQLIVRPHHYLLWVTLLFFIAFVTELVK